VQEVTLYQFALCPFCSKVRAGLALKAIRYKIVEVNPRSKVELPKLPDGAPRKVPVLVVDHEVVADSTQILRFLDRAFPDTTRFRPEPESLSKRADEIEEWIDAELIRALPTVLYGTWREAGRAAAVIGKSGNFGAMQGLGLKLGGSVIMHLVAKRILKKSGRANGHAWVAENLDQVEAWLGAQPFLCGDTLTIADVALYGALSCVREFPIFASIEARPPLQAWLARVESVQVEARASAREQSNGERTSPN
jgi:glutathione S-transferase